MGRRSATNIESLSSWDLLKAIKDPQQSLEENVKSFITYVISHLPEGICYTLPRNLSEAANADSFCHGSRIDVEYMLPALVLAGLLGLK